MQPRDVVEALGHSSAASALRPDSARFHHDVGMCYLDLRSFDQAAAAFRRSIALRRDSATAHLRLGEALASRQDWDGAATAYREASRLGPDEPRTYTDLMMALATAGRHAEARQVPLTLLQQNPSLAGPRSAFCHNAAAETMDCAVRQGKHATPPSER